MRAPQLAGTGVAHACVRVVCVAAALFAGGCATHTPHHRDASVGSAHVEIDAYELIRDAADSEGLFTLAGGLKPMSSGFWRGGFMLGDPDLKEIRAVRDALHVLRTGEWYADVQVFADEFEGERFASAFIVHRASLAEMIGRYAEFWGPYGVTPDTHPAEIVAVVDRMEKADRWRGYGYLFGYPADAVDFFVDAGLAAEDGREVGPGKDRRFVQITTFGSETGRFTYAVALDTPETDEDRALAAEAASILGAYTDRRGRMTDLGTLVSELRRLNRRFEGAALAP